MTSNADPTPVILEKRGLNPHLTPELLRPDPILRQSIVAKLTESGRSDLAEGLRTCRTVETFCHCRDCHACRAFWNRCDLFYCPECARILAWKRRKSLAFWEDYVKQPKHVVLTIRNSESLTRTRVHFIKTAFARLRKTTFAQAWNGGLWSLEVTNESKGWHLHQHALIDAAWIDQPELARQWAKQVRQDFAIVKVKDARERNYLAEVIKYTTKGTDLASWDASYIAEYIEAFTDSRSFGTFGQLHKDRAAWTAYKQTTAKEPCQCTKCNGTNLDFISPQQFDEYQCSGRIPSSVAPPTTQP
jgi:hypothetical protein